MIGLLNLYKILINKNIVEGALEFVEFHAKLKHPLSLLGLFSLSFTVDLEKGWLELLK